MTSEKEQQIKETNGEQVEQDRASTRKSKKAKSTKDKKKKQSAAEQEIEKLKGKITTLETELTVALEAKILAEDRMKRVVAEFENMKKRQEREFDRALKFARENLIRELLPLLDDLERSAQFDSDGTQQQEAEDDTKDSHKTGIRMIYERFLKYLQDVGVERFDPTGEPFNPDIHDAMMTRPAENGDSGIVVESFQPGYKMGDRILRHAKVIVSE
ncbi:MAG: nucleotide exchange factor GrpE [Candidatus Marinimicrobia bacterium]|nr:nucleotide exchange factor GrpE [Candidatus Neomarinimicrobiota bacterium]MCF7839189.1 nucleotide exchange factor GrpE [Candidatus Neomarinimicrobiota bacterium]MCF7902370.1 nucleotide exchange factor GrpE [Candidatus Neomarinimicrobiota bacterium]